ncbi:hypothetical protein ACIP9X_08640, partial [Arthrobacter sp. NPDC093125]|uniref:hypothetical protein n=1 Tax=Arthrobacter sp. NPDC093125 TaxID=3363944 RepID=UPI003820EB08
MTLRSFVIRGLAFVAATLLLVSGMAAPVLAADIDENIPPSLVTIHRSSPETVRHGDEIRIDWVVQGSPAGNVIFYLRDRLGNQVQARWDAPSGTSAFAGTATATIDVMRVAAGDLALSSFGAGNGYANSNYGSDGSVGKSPEGVQEPIQASFDYAQVSSRVESSRDISIPPSLVSMNRTSPDVIRDGDQLMIDWEVKNSPATNVIFYLRDRLGSQVQVRWDAPNGTDAFAGTATATIDDTRVAAGDLVLSSFGVGNGYANSSYGTDGSIGKSPEGAQDPLHVAFDYAQISSRVESSRDVSVPPSLVNAKRTSPDMLRVGDQIMIDWEVRNSPATNVIFYLRDSLGNQLQARWDTPNAEAAFSGTATASIDAGVAEGDLVLTSFGAGNGYANSNYGVDGSVGSSPEGAQDPIPTVFDYAQVTSSVVSVSDVSVPPSLVSFQRTSSDVVRAGDEITIDWAVQDRPVSYIGFYLRDSLGHTQNVRWDGPEAFSGTARYVVDDTQLAAGDLELVTVSMVSTNSKMTYSSDGTVNRNPSGLKAPKPSLLNFADAGVELVSERDISVPPSLVSFQRTSSDVVRAGDEITIDWAVQDRPVSYIGFYLRDSLGHTQNVRWDGPEAFSGTARYLVDDTQLAAGDLELVTVSMVSTNSKMTYSSDGTVNRNPSGLKAPKPSLLNFADAGVELVSERDISVPPSLVSFQRTSSDVVRAGDEITIDWAVQDRPVSYIGFYLRDSLGHTQNVRWDGPEAFSGTARYLVDDTQLAAGDLDLVTVSMISTNSKMTYSSDGTVNRNPSGLEAPKPSVLNFADAGVHLSPPAPYEVVVIAPGFIDEDGTTADTYTIPAMAGVEYLAGDEVV